LIHFKVAHGPVETWIGPNVFRAADMWNFLSSLGLSGRTLNDAMRVGSGTAGYAFLTLSSHDFGPFL
jgi:hypothetical protein